jgi:hypothetical protein
MARQCMSVLLWLKREWASELKACFWSGCWSCCRLCNCGAGAFLLYATFQAIAAGEWANNTCRNWYQNCGRHADVSLASCWFCRRPGCSWQNCCAWTRCLDSTAPLIGTTAGEANDAQGNWLRLRWRSTCVACTGHWGRRNQCLRSKA